jgi:hypothetical protein
MKRLAVAVSLAAALWAGAAVAPASDSVALSPSAYAKSCSSRYVHAIIGGEHKCLAAGQFCARRYDRRYHRYGFHCHRWDPEVERYRLTR